MNDGIAQYMADTLKAIEGQITRIANALDLSNEFLESREGVQPLPNPDQPAYNPDDNLIK